MRSAWLLLFTLACAVRTGNAPNPKSFCQTAGWYIDGPRRIALHREATFRVRPCAADASPGTLTWSVSDDAVIRIVATAEEHVRIKGIQYGMADLVVFGSNGQFVLAVTVE